MNRNTAQNGFASGSGGSASGPSLYLHLFVLFSHEVCALFCFSGWYLVSVSPVFAACAICCAGAFFDDDMDDAPTVRQRRSRPRGAAAAAGRDLDALHVRHTLHHLHSVLKLSRCISPGRSIVNKQVHKGVFLCRSWDGVWECQICSPSKCQLCGRLGGGCRSLCQRRSLTRAAGACRTMVKSCSFQTASMWKKPGMWQFLSCLQLLKPWGFEALDGQRRRGSYDWT
jgi:hypothetical protein